MDVDLIEEILEADKAEIEASFNNIEDLLTWLNNNGR